MIDMATWKNLTVGVVDDLYLDPHNVRLDLPQDSITQEDLIRDLFSNEKALSLVDGIVKVGYLTHEVPIVVRRDGKLFVVEGNRRVAALKAIHNPDLVPEHKARVNRLIDGFTQQADLLKITVKVAPSQEDANQLIAALHTGNQRHAWKPQRQAAFFQAQIDAGKTPEQLIAQYPTIDVKKFIVRSKILELFRKVDYDDSELQDFIRNRRFPISTLARLYEHGPFLQLVRIDVDEAEARVKLRAPRKQFATVAEKIIGDIKKNRINTRVLNSPKGVPYGIYMDELRELVDLTDSDEEAEEEIDEDPEPAASQAPGGGATTTAPPSTPQQPPQAPPSQAGAPPTPPPATPEKKARESRKFLKTEHLQVPVGFPAPVHLIFRELSELNTIRFPNATFDLLRSFLEKSIKAYADSQNESISAHLKLTGFVQLGHCLQWIEQWADGTRMSKACSQAATVLRSQKVGDFAGSARHHNAINHNHLVFASAEDVRNAWMAMEGLLKEILKP